MSDDPHGPSLWFALAGFLVFCVVVGLLLGFIAYEAVQKLAAP